MTGRQLGTLVVRGRVVRRQAFEVAAWFKDHLLEPGEYPLYEAPIERGRGIYVAWAEVPSTIIDACFIPLYGGVSHGEDFGGQEVIGTKDVWWANVWCPETEGPLRSGVYLLDADHRLPRYMGQGEVV